MREHKYRGKRLDNGEWAYGDLIKATNGFATLNSRYDWSIEREMINNKICVRGIPCLDLTDVDPETIGQFTGLEDKNGVDIYEGDIIKTDNSIGVVMFSTEDVWSCGCCNENFDGSGFVGKGHYLMQLSNCKIIGNKFDNPELLEDK